MEQLSYWFYFGTIYLCFLTYQDYKNNMLVDDRRNSFMLGLSISLISHVYTSLLYKIILSVTIILLYKFLKKTKATGEADINTITWVFLGLGLIHYSYLTIFVIIFIAVMLLWYFIKVILLKDKKQSPFYAVILLSFITTTILIKGY